MSADGIVGPFFRYWGKAQAAQHGAAFHFLPYHSLDVAAVAAALWSRHHRLRAQLCSLLDWPEETVGAWLVAYAALHDLGKFSSAFQSLRPDVAAQLGLECGRYRYQRDYRHDRLGVWLWQSLNAGALSADADWQVVGNHWAASATCHHGQPRPIPAEWDSNLGRHFSKADREAAQAWTDWVLSHIAPLPLPERPVGEAGSRVRHASWLLAGVYILCDWIGSNASVGRFEYCDRPCQDDRALLAYWANARVVAEQAVLDFGVLPASVDGSAGFTDIFPHIAVPSPLQAQVVSLPLSAGPALYVIEDVTGAGKTEAALSLAQRLMQAGRADGLFIGLPTMATTNAMYERLGRDYRRFYDAGHQPSLVLAHSARQLSAAFMQSCHTASFPDLQVDDDYGGEGSAATWCNAWIADSRKKTFFADMGVGTLDQALMAVLPSKHQSLKLAGLGVLAGPTLFTFNVDSQRFLGSTAVRCVQKGERAKVCAKLSGWAYAGEASS
ncbi:CRISPR-associated endonuclease Cas3'' [Chitinimonas sp. JJ19]|uniref:CRISPR-associated endonuclease Cas3'' n=1 Tax=Chitinimonas sp. JJ19 TaxID=3109352 RepID=UPI00300249E9